MKLLPCPLCGSEARAGYDGDYYAQYNFFIACTDSKCEVLLPVPTGDASDRKNVKVGAEYVNQWNTRVLIDYRLG